MATASKEQEKNPWPQRLKAWNKFSEKFHTRGREIENRYQDDREAESVGRPSLNEPGIKKVNLFFSNTTVIKDSLYNSLPKPDVSRLHKGEVENEPARVAATILERGLTYEIHCAKYFDQAVKSAILDRLVPGLGVLWLTFVPPEGLASARYAEQTQAPPAEAPMGAPQPGQPPGPPQGILPSSQAQMPLPGMPPGPPPQKQAGLQPKPPGKPEEITVDIVYWRDFLYEPQKAWEQVTWAGRILHVDKEEAKKRWGEKALSAKAESDRSVGTSVSQDAIEEGKVNIIQMWDKKKKRVLHLTSGGEILDNNEDPYQLTGFWPFPKPLCASPPTAKFLPLADYYIAQDQYMECDILYARINLIIEAVRVAGCYDSSVPAIGRVLDGTENKLVPVDNWAMFAEKGGMQGSISWYPVETVTAVLQQLVTTYEFLKNQLFEVTGMADIIRGSSNQYETAQAQQIKAKFASVRMNAYQRDVSFFVRDTLRIMAEMMAQLYSDEKLFKVCGQLPQEDQPFVPMALELLRSDFLAKYTVDIQADSLTQSDWALEQEQRIGFIEVLSGYLQALVPAIEAQPDMAPLLAQAIKFAIVGFKGSAELEGIIDASIKKMEEMIAQKKANPQESPEAQAAKAEQQKQQFDMQMKQQEFQMKQQAQQSELQFMQQRFTAELQFKTQMYALELQHKREMAQIESEQRTARAMLETQQNQERFARETAQDEAAAAAKLAAGQTAPPVAGP